MLALGQWPFLNAVSGRNFWTPFLDGIFGCLFLTQFLNSIFNAIFGGFLYTIFPSNFCLPFSDGICDAIWKLFFETNFQCNLQTQFLYTILTEFLKTFCWQNIGTPFLDTTSGRCFGRHCLRSFWLLFLYVIFRRSFWMPFVYSNFIWPFLFPFFSAIFGHHLSDMSQICNKYMSHFNPIYDSKWMFCI